MAMLCKSSTNSLSKRLPELRKVTGVNTWRGQGFSNAAVAAALKKTSRLVYPNHPSVTYENDYSEEPEYPVINPETHKWNESRRRRLQDILDRHKRIQDQPTVEAKTVELNLPRKFGWHTKVFEESLFEYDSQEMYKFLTQTFLASDTELPDVYSSKELTEKAKHFAQKVQEPLLEALKFETEGVRLGYDKDLSKRVSEIDYLKTQSIINQVNRIILLALEEEVGHLKTSEVDYTPNIEAFWQIGGQQPDKKERAIRKGWHSEKLQWRRSHIKPDDPIERNVMYKGSPLLQLRCDNPIQNFVSESSDLCKKLEDSPSVFPYNLSNYSVSGGMKYGSFILGTWKGDSHKNSHIAFHAQHHLLADPRRNNKYWNEDNGNAITSQAILSSFGRLLSQAMYYGFDQFSDLNYPFSTQTVVTNGLDYSFFAYQLNTIKLSQMHLAKNKRQNIVWGTKSMNIFDDKHPDKLNSEVLETLIKFYLNSPTPLATEHPTPYLQGTLNDWDDEIQREIIYYNYRDMVSQRFYRYEGFLSRKIPEIYDWEKIYKVRHNQRWIEPRRRFFELPLGFKGSRPYDEPYPLLDPRKIRRGLRNKIAAVEAKEEAKRLELAKKSESERFNRGFEDSELS